MNPQNPQYLLAQAYAEARGRWRGCDWSTMFGHFGFNLKGVQSRLAHVWADATSGYESECWLEAFHWLAQVERDARAAEAAARAAINHAERQDLESAFKCIQQAIAMESKYRTATVWSPLTTVISQLYHESQHDNSHA